MRPALSTLYVLYAARCGLCASIKQRLEWQPKFVGLVFVPAGSAAAAHLLQDLPPPLPDDLIVVSNTGCVWRGDHAWLMVLWALRDFRGWVRRLSTPALLPFARAAFAALSHGRGTLSACLRLEVAP